MYLIQKWYLLLIVQCQCVLFFAFSIFLSSFQLPKQVYRCAGNIIDISFLILNILNSILFNFLPFCFCVKLIKCECAKVKAIILPKFVHSSMLVFQNWKYCLYWSIKSVLRQHQFIPLIIIEYPCIFLKLKLTKTFY